MTLNRRVFAAWSGATAALGSLSACSTPGSTAAAVALETRTLDELHRAALSEGGTLIAYGGGDLPNGAAGLETAFMRRFPGLKIRIFVDRSKFQGVRIDNQLARHQLQPDVVHILAHHYYDRWKAQGLLLPYKAPGWDQIEPSYTDPDAAWTATSIFAFSTYVNTTLLPESEAPRDAQDFLEPKLKGRIALTYPNEDDSILYQFDRIIAVHGWGWLERLAAQDVLWVQGSGYNRQLIDRGERAVSFNTSGALVPAANAKTRFLLPRNDSFLSWAHPTAIFKQTRKPETAKLYMAWLLSAERQGGRMAWSVRRDMPPPVGYGPLSQYKTSPAGFRAALQDRARLEQLRDQITQVIGPAPEPNPTKVFGVFPEGLRS